MMPRPLGNHRGVTLVELLVAVAAFIVVGFGMSALYLAGRRAFDYGSAHAFVQRQGTQIQEEIMSLMLPATSVQVMACGPSGAAPSLMAVLTPEAAARDLASPQSRFRCLYQFADTALGDVAGEPQLYTCKLRDDPPAFASSPPAPGTNCVSVGGSTNATKVNLLRQRLSETAVRLGSRLRVANTTFTQVATVGGIPVARPAVDVRFDLTDQTSVFNTQTGQLGLRFGFVITARN